MSGLVVSCGSTQGSASPAASSARTGSRALHETPTAPISLVATSPPIARAEFPVCRLPNLKIRDDDPHLTGGFVGGPQGLWTEDPNGGITRSGEFLYTTDTTPTLKGDGVSVSHGPTAGQSCRGALQGCICRLAASRPGRTLVMKAGSGLSDSTVTVTRLWRFMGLVHHRALESSSSTQRQQ